MSRPRRLFLQTSALSDHEYAIYYSALNDLLDDVDESSQVTNDDDWENKTFSAREVRSWMRDLYTDFGSIDKILRIFTPSIGPTDTLNGGQLVAAFRLLIHARNGTPVVEGLVFVQATFDIAAGSISKHRPARKPCRLFVHASALSDKEYDIYLSALHNLLDSDDADKSSLIDDRHLENTVLNAREIRRWMRRRYKDVGSIDQILRMFAPSLGPADALTGGQFFAALRFLMHVRSGNSLAAAERLVYVQAIPSSPSTAASVSEESHPSSRTTTGTSKFHSTSAVKDLLLNRPTEHRRSDGAIQIPPSPPRPIPLIPASKSNDDTTATSNSNYSKMATNPVIQLSKSHVSPSISSPSSLSVNMLASSKVNPLPADKPTTVCGSRSTNPDIPYFPTLPSTSSTFTGTSNSPPEGTMTEPVRRQHLRASKDGTSSQNAQTVLEKGVRDVDSEVLRSSRNSTLFHNHHVNRNENGHDVDVTANQNQKLNNLRRLGNSPPHTGTTPGRLRRPAPSPPRIATSSASVVRKVVVTEYSGGEGDSGKHRSRRGSHTSTIFVEPDADQQDAPEPDLDHLMNGNVKEEAGTLRGTPKSLEPPEVVLPKRRHGNPATIVKDKSGRFWVQPGVHPCSKCEKKGVPCLTTDKPKINKCFNCRSQKLGCDVVIGRLGQKRGRAPGPSGSAGPFAKKNRKE